MEGTHTVLQLHKPIMELCYVSFYLPKGKVRGFTYTGCVTLDASNKRFHNCYQVREGYEQAGLRAQTCENIGDIFFKQTTTKDILTELYKLNAEKERLLATLLSSTNILGVKMGNQDGKLQEVSESLKYKDDDRLHPQGSLLGSMEKKSILKNKRNSKRRDSIEDFMNKKLKRKMPAVLERPAPNCKEILLENNKLHSTKNSANVSSVLFTNSYQKKVEGKDDLLSDVNKLPERSRKEYLLEDSQAIGSDTDLSLSFSEYDNDVFGHCFAHSNHSLLDDVEDALKVNQVQQSSPLQNTFQETSIKKPKAFDKTVASEVVHGYNLAENCKSKHKDKDRKTQDLEDQLQNVDSTSIEFGERSYAMNNMSKESMGSVFASMIPEKAHEGCIQHIKEEQDHVVNERYCLEGAINKTLLKVIQNDRLDDTAEWKRFQHISSPTGLIHEKRAPVPQANKHLALHLPINVNPDICQTRTNIKQEDKGPLSPSLLAVSNVFNTSYPPSNTHKQMSPLPSPLSSSLPSPQLHHRILPLPAQDTEESVLREHHNSGHSATKFPLGKDLKVQLHPSFSDFGHPGLFMRQPGLYQDASVDRPEKSSPPEKNSVPLQPQLHSGITTEAALKNDFSEQAANMHVINRDDDAWVLDCRLELSTHFSESGRADRNVLHLDLNFIPVPYPTPSTRSRFFRKLKWELSSNHRR
ncbi:formin-1-like [Varanus komodoensis]|uniref:formin-1-like n=1 Tax=Varanus komodoensis TaxID=61221 RepID=UPI001CF7754A|nr:formin-1-like [Varanus komodoensis]